MTVNNFLKDIKTFGEKNPNIEAILLVGSYAHGTNNKDSDIDIVIISKIKEAMVKSPDFIYKFGDVLDYGTEIYGACTSLRVFYKNGLEVEFGLVAPSWISLPLDPGTYQVLKDGYKVILDKKDYFENFKFKKELKSPLNFSL